MAERNFDFLETLGRKRRLIAGSFVPNGSSAIDNTQNMGSGFTVAYTSTGLYTITFKDKYSKRLFADASLEQATRSQDVEVNAVDAPNGTMTVNGYARGGTTLADITAAGGTRINFVVVFDDSLHL
jgi:hypothetical protein